ncbi:hypothetical protein DVK02_04730 [Halobellus sp. Atlit-31R]|nr:hypothetical protein DVK02_04730 [Halobellus sp. Atlit-31R]
MGVLPTDRGQAESIATVLLVAVVVVSATTFGAYYVESSTEGSAGGAAGSAGSASGTPVEITMAATDESLTLVHNGGPSVASDALRVVVANASGEFSYDFESGQIRDGGGTDGRFDPGETWRLGWDQAGGSEITVSVVDDATGSLLFQQTVTIESAAESDTDGRADGMDAAERTLAVDAGPQRTVSGERGSSVGLDGSTGASGDSVTYRWEIVDYDGLSTTAVAVVDADSLDSTFEVRENVSDATHTVVVELTVENATASGEDRTAVTVEQANQPPVADAGEDKALESNDDTDRGDEEENNGRGDGGDGGDDGSDGDGRNDALEKPLYVSGAAVLYPPTGQMAPAAADVDGSNQPEGPHVELNGSGSYDPDGGRLQYEWTIVGYGGLEASNVKLTQSDTATPEFILLRPRIPGPRTATVKLTVTDSAGTTATDRVNVTMYPDVDPTIESFDADPSTVLLADRPVDATLTTSATHPTDELSYDYRVGLGGLGQLFLDAELTEQSPGSARITVSRGLFWGFVADGNQVQLPVTVFVSDGDGETTTDTLYVSVEKS